MALKNAKLNIIKRFISALSTIKNEKNTMRNTIAASLLLTLGLTAQAQAVCIDLLPTQSSSTKVIQSGEYSSTYPGWKVFDSSSDNSNWISETWETPAYVGYKFSQESYVNQYTIKYNNGNILTRSPKDFELQGYNTSWVTLDSKTNQTNWYSGESRSFSVSNPGAYQQYRLLINDDNDSRSGVVVASINDLNLEYCYYP